MSPIELSWTAKKAVKKSLPLYTADHQNQEQGADGEALAYYADVGEEVN